MLMYGWQTLLVLFPSNADKEWGRESFFDFVVLSLGASSVSSWPISISLPCSLDMIACGFPRAIYRLHNW